MNGTNPPLHSVLHGVLVNTVCQLGRVQNHLGDKPRGVSAWECLAWVSLVGRPTLDVSDIIPWARGPRQNRNTSIPGMWLPCHLLRAPAMVTVLSLGTALLNCEPK